MGALDDVLARQKVVNAKSPVDEALKAEVENKGLFSSLDATIQDKKVIPLDVPLDNGIDKGIVKEVDKPNIINSKIIIIEPKKEIKRVGRPGRLRDWEIRDRIQDRLALRPHTNYELARALGCSEETVMNHGDYLASLGVIFKMQYKDKTLWKGK